MKNKKRYTFEEKLSAVGKHLGGKSLASLKMETGIDPQMIAAWTDKYVKYGAEALKRRTYRRFPERIKRRAVRDLEEKGLTLRQVSLEYGASMSALKLWKRTADTDGSIGGGLAAETNPYVMPRQKRNRKEPETEMERILLENEYLRTENALLKKLSALIQEKERGTRGQRKPSRN